MKSLLHRVYKAKYFPHTHLLETKLGPNPSYAWKGIWEARKMLMKRGRWRIGNGAKVKIWQDSWVPRVFPLSIPQNTLGLDPQTAKVDMLMDSYHSCWNLEAIHSLFDP